MTIQEIMLSKKISRYRLSKNSGIPYTTINDIYSEKAQLEKCSAETIYKIARELGVSMEDLIAPCFDKRNDFELFKSNVCHQLKELGDVDFIISIIENDDIRKYYKKKWYPESFYLLAMLDYVSCENGIPLCVDYDDLRRCKLQQIIYPSSILVMAEVKNDISIKERAFNNAIPEFKRFNIVESEVRNVI